MRLRPRALRRAKTLRPPGLCMRFLKPLTRLRFLWLPLKVRFMTAANCNRSGTDIIAALPYNVGEMLKFRPSPAQTTMLSFVLLSLVGAFLLSLPAANTSGEWRDWLSALFMSTSSVCVTGLVVADPGSDFTLLGQAVILALIQIGGLSYMTLTTILIYLIGRKLSFTDSRVFDLSNNSDRRIDFTSFVLKIGLLTLLIEGVGFLFLLVDSYKKYINDHPGANTFSVETLGQTAFHSLFHAVSAFCNAGLSLYSNSMESFHNNPWVLFVIAALPVLGGLGYTVLTELSDLFFEKKQRQTISLHSRVSLVMTAILLVGGFLVLFFMLSIHKSEIITSLNLGERLGVAAFQSTISRSAGFNSFPIQELGEPAHIFLMFLMLIGACPGSTAGGIKVTTLAAIAAMVRAGLRNSPDVKLFNRALSNKVQRTAIIVFVSSLFVIAIAISLLEIFEEGHGIRFIDKLFEVVSAFNNVGLSTGITSDLSGASQFVLILCMLIGRPGSMLLLMSFINEERSQIGKYPEEAILIG